MAILPGHDKLPEFSSAQLAWITFCQYLMVLFNVLTLIWTVCNAWRFLVKQRKWIVLPLVSFYIVAMINVFCGAIFVIWLFPIILNKQIPLHFIAQTTKFSLGLDQSWINVELCLSIRHSIKMVQSSPNSRPKFPAKFIKIGRIVHIVFITIFITSVIVLTIVANHHLDYDQKAKLIDFGLDQYTICLEAIDFVLLSASITVLMYLLNKQQQFQDDNRAFKREKA